MLIIHSNTLTQDITLHQCKCGLVKLLQTRLHGNVHVLVEPYLRAAVLYIRLLTWRQNIEDLNWIIVDSIYLSQQGKDSKFPQK